MQNLWPSGKFGFAPMFLLTFETHPENAYASCTPGWKSTYRALEHQRETLSISHCKKIRAKKRGRERKKSQVKRSKDKRALLLRKSTLIYSQLSLQTTFSFFHVKLVDVFVVANSKVRVWNWASDREQRRIFTSLISSKNWAHILALTVKGTSGETGKWTWM